MSNLPTHTLLHDEQDSTHQSNADPPSSTLPSRILDSSEDLNSRNASANHDKSVTAEPHSPPPSNAAITDLPPSPSIQFHSRTIAPSPTIPEDYTSTADSSSQKHTRSPLSPSSFRLRTDPNSTSPPRSETSPVATHLSSSRSLQHKTSASSLKPVSRTPSFKTAIANSIGTASACSSAVPSPIISALPDVTPLPSPLLPQDSPGPWRRRGSRPPSRETMPAGPGTVLVSRAGETIAAALVNASKRKALTGLSADDITDGKNPGDGSESGQHGRNRSLSEYVPDPASIPQRHVTVSGSHVKPGETDTAEPHMRRELNLAGSRGLATVNPPTPPPSEKESSDLPPSEAPKKEAPEVFEAVGRHDGKKRRWRAVRYLGQGTFSRVVLATSQIGPDEDESAPEEEAGALTPRMDSHSHLDRKTLVAVKVCEHGPRGGASEERIEMSLKRELEIMKSIKHPSLVHLKAWNIEPSRAILVLSYCPGGDLFDVATGYREVLVPSLVRRMFAELVGAVRYLHERRIVHRDIKLENVLVNIPPSELADASVDWARYPYSVVTLTDLGLSRRIADDERLETRCGSEDYAAPEVIMGQPYDGRATDAWSLGVLLYAILEARLPFDPNPAMSDYHRMRSRTSHRIARVEWKWIEYAGDDGEHDGDTEKFRSKGLLGAMEITEGLLKRARSRWTMGKVSDHEWVKEAIDGGLVFREEEEGEEVL